MARAWLGVAAGFALACSGTDAGPGRQENVNQSGTGQELIPAEWTVAEDTSATGEVTTASLQLPNAREIGDLVDEAAPRLILRCLGGKVRAFIDPESAPAGADPSMPDTQLIEVQLDSAPACE